MLVSFFRHYTTIGMHAEDWMALLHFTVSALLNLFQRIPTTIYNCLLGQFIFCLYEGGAAYNYFKSTLNNTVL